MTALEQRAKQTAHSGDKATAEAVAADAALFEGLLACTTFLSHDLIRRLLAHTLRFVFAVFALALNERHGNAANSVVVPWRL